MPCNNKDITKEWRQLYIGKVDLKKCGQINARSRLGCQNQIREEIGNIISRSFAYSNKREETP